MNAYNFVGSGRNFTMFFPFNAEKILLVNAVLILLLSSSFPAIFAFNSKVVVKRTKFCTFFALPNFKGRCP